MSQETPSSSREECSHPINEQERYNFSFQFLIYLVTNKVYNWCRLSRGSDMFQKVIQLREQFHVKKAFWHRRENFFVKIG